MYSILYILESTKYKNFIQFAFQKNDFKEILIFILYYYYYYLYLYFFIFEQGYYINNLCSH